MVQNIESPRSGRAVANQFIIRTNKGTFFQSYNSVVAKIDNKGVVTLGRDWDYSNTTRKYLYEFLRNNGYPFIDRKDILQKLKSKEFKYKERIAI